MYLSIPGAYLLEHGEDWPWTPAATFLEPDGFHRAQPTNHLQLQQLTQLLERN